MSAWGSGRSRLKTDYKAVISQAAFRNENSAVYQGYHTFSPFGILYSETKAPEYDEMGNKKPVPLMKAIVPSKVGHEVQPHDKISLKISIIADKETRSHLQISIITDTPPTSKPSEEFVVRVRLHGDNVNGASRIIDSSHKDWAEVLKKIPYIATRTPGWYEKSAKRTKGKPSPQRVVDQNWINNNIRVLQLHWDSSSGITSENLYVSTDLPWQPALRAVAALQDLFSKQAGFIEMWVRQEATTIEQAWDALKVCWKEENTKGDVFRRFYSAKIQTSRRMGYIDAGSAIVQSGSRPAVYTRRDVVMYDLLELTTRLGVAMIQLAEYDQLVVNQLNSSPTAIKLLRIAGAGDRLYTGFLQVAGDVEKRLADGDVLKISFRPGDARQDEEWNAVVVPSHALGRSGEVVLDLFRPRIPLSDEATLEEKSRPRPFVGLDLSKYTADPAFESIDEVRSVLNSTTSIVVEIKVQRSQLCMKRCLNGIRNLQHSGKQETKSDGTQPWVQSDTTESLGKHLLMHDTRAFALTDFLGNAGREALGHMVEEDHLNVIKYLSNVPTDKHGVAVAVVEGYPGVGKTTFVAQMMKALVKTSTKQYLVIAPSNAPADVAAMAIHSACIKDAIDSGEVIVRAHSTHTESSFMQSYALKEHKTELARVLLEDNDDLDDDNEPEIEAFIPLDIENVPPPMKPEGNGFGSLDEPLMESDTKEAIPSEVTEKSENRMLDSYNNGIPIMQHIAHPQDSANDSETISKVDAADDPVLATTVRAPDFVPLSTDDEIFGKGEAIRLTEDELDATAQVNTGSYNADGSINVDLGLTDYVKLSLLGVDLTKAVNQRISPGESLVKDRRFQVFEQSLGYWSLAIAGIIPVESKHKDAVRWASLATLFHTFVVEGERMSSESQVEFRAQLKLLREFTISTVRVVVTTPVTACAPEFYNNLVPDIIIIDEAGRLNRADYLMILGHYDTKKLILLGDRMQLDPVVAGPKTSVGFIDDLKMSVLEWYSSVWWPSMALYVQRRSWKGLMDVVSSFSYRNAIKDGLDSESQEKHPWSVPMMTAMSELFPDFSRKDSPNFYFELDGDDAIKDEITKSWFNLKSASLAVNIIMSCIEKGIPTGAFGIITAYSAQVDVCVHALYTLHLANPTLGYDKIPVNTCDDFQGGQKPIIIFLPVVTRRPGFVNTKGRLTVSISRATDCFIAIGSTNNLDDPPKGPNNLRRIYDIARAKKLVLCIPSYHPLLHNAYVSYRAQTIDLNMETVNGWVESSNQQAAYEWDEGGSNQQAEADANANADMLVGSESNQQADVDADADSNASEDAVSVSTTEEAANEGILNNNAIPHSTLSATTPMEVADIGGTSATNASISSNISASADSNALSSSMIMDNAPLATGFGALPDDDANVSGGDFSDGNDMDGTGSDDPTDW